MYLIQCACLALALRLAASAPASGFNFPDDRKERKSEIVITPPVLPVLAHLERDPSTLVPNETVQGRSAGAQGRALPQGRDGQKGWGPRRDPRLGFGGGFSVVPSNGGLTASVSSSASGAGASHAASQSFSFGFNQGFSGSHSASQSSSFNGFGSGLSSSQASSQAASFSGSGGSGSAAASSASSLAGGGHSGSQSAASAFGFNSGDSYNSYPPYDEVNFGDDVIDIRHRGAPRFPFPTLPGLSGPSRKGVGAAAFKTGGKGQGRGRDDWLAVILSD